MEPKRELDELEPPCLQATVLAGHHARRAPWPGGGSASPMSAARALPCVLRASFDGVWRDDVAAFFAGRSDEQIAALVEALTLEQLGQRVVGATFASKSVGVVFGLELASGESVVLKLFDRAQSKASLATIHRCIDRLVAAGFPATPGRSAPFATSDGILGAFYARLDGAQRDGHEPPVRRELARSLAELTATLAAEPSHGLPPAPTRGTLLWPPPHRSFLTLEATTSEAEAIDACGRRAQQAVKACSLPLLPAHFDWGVKNARFEGDRIVAVYDWDSLVAASEAELVGRASVQFTAQWDFPARLTPTPAEEAAFVADYESARGRPFSDVERQVLHAAASYSVAQIARLELAARTERDDGFLAMQRARAPSALRAP